MPELLNVAAALRQILAAITTLPAEEIPLDAALDRVLAADVVADVSLPPFANSSMDGFAVRAADVAAASPEAPARLPVTLDVPAGAAPARALGPGEAARIMTGAPLPAGADAVVPVEATDAAWNAAEASAPPQTVAIGKAVVAGDYVRPVGEDITAGQTVLPAGTLIGPAEIGVLASLGQAVVPVIRQPRVAILSGGDELVEVDEPLLPGKIRNSNSLVLAALVTQHGGLPLRIPTARDTLEDVRRRFHEALALEPDLVLSSAGVSVGAHDVIRAVLDELGRVDLWRINLRPGKPLAFGQVQGVPFFGLPGNPVSTQVTFDVIVRPALCRLAGRPDHAPTVEAVLAEDIHADGRLTYFRVTLQRGEDGGLIATSTGTQSSGAMRSMVLADGLLIVPAGRKSAR
ncbi:MAG: molybdopterin molybdotransferase MoeA, partial [Anaerolineae bacterium]|nr:molybdopterin molybdotransferase MoeA [Anaerolineae bacterium]